MSKRERDQDRERERGSRGQAAQARTNEYFVPRDGIDREVITADICRYLGNDALVRPGNYQVSPYFYVCSSWGGNDEMTRSLFVFFFGRTQIPDKFRQAISSPRTEILQP
jgi:hypothetical protein